MSTKRGRPWQLVLKEEYDTMVQARMREKQIKSWKGGNAFKALVSKAAGSSNGRMRLSESRHLGSTPSPAVLRAPPVGGEKLREGSELLHFRLGVERRNDLGIQIFMTFTIRSYTSSDYSQVASLYKQSDLYGGQFDENRDSEEKLTRVITKDPEAILICESEEKILGTISLIEDGRVAWLFRFAVEKNKNEQEVIKALHDKALKILNDRGHRQVLVYTPVSNKELKNRYSDLGFTKGNDYSCFWKDI